MLVDHHTHHYRCGHAKGTLEDVIVSALEKGLDGIGLSDHSPIYHMGDGDHEVPGTAMAKSEFPNYFDEMKALKQKYAGQIEVKLAVESDYIEDLEDHYRELWSSYDFDYVIGSIHWLGRWNIFRRDLPSGLSAIDVYEKYLIKTQRAAKSGLFDILGHIDCLKTAGHMPTRDITPLMEETIKVIAEADVAIELNTSGWRKPVGECYPGPELLACCRQYGVPVALSSDAHSPDLVAADFERACNLLLEVGYTEHVTFHRRKRTSHPIDLGRVRQLATG